MELTVLERFVLQNVLPTQGNMLDLVTAKNIRKAISFSEDELATLKIQQDGEQVRWDSEAAADMTKEVEWTGPQTKMIVEALQKLDAEKKLTADHLSLCEKFGIGQE